MAPADTQWICDPERRSNCRCAGDDGRFTCDCTREPNIAGNCDICGSPMVLINVDTGEPMARAAL